MHKNKQFRSAIKGLLTSLWSFSFSTGSPDRYVTTDPAGGIGPHGSPVPAATQPEGATRVSDARPG